MTDGRVVDQGPTFDELRSRKTLDEADLVPPQMVDLSLLLPVMAPRFAGTSVATANTLAEMQAAIEDVAADGAAAMAVSEKDAFDDAPFQGSERKER